MLFAVHESAWMMNLLVYYESKMEWKLLDFEVFKFS